MTDAGEGSVHHDPFRHTLGIECRKGIAYHIANVVSDEGDFLDSHLIEDCSHVPSLGGLFVTAFGMGGQAHATEIRNDDSVVFDQWFGERYPHIPRVAEAMQQEYRRALTTDPNILGASAYRHLPGAKGVRPDADRSVRCRRQGCKCRGEGRQRCGTPPGSEEERSRVCSRGLKGQLERRFFTLPPQRRSPTHTTTKVRSPGLHQISAHGHYADSRNAI